MIPYLSYACTSISQANSQTAAMRASASAGASPHKDDIPQLERVLYAARQVVDNAEALIRAAGGQS